MAKKSVIFVPNAKNKFATCPIDFAMNQESIALKASMKLSHSIRRIIIAIGFLLSTSLVGVTGFKAIEGYSLVDAVYMTIITMSTVGFGTVRELSEGGKLFASILIIISAGTFVYAITTITTFVIEGEVRQIFNIFRVNQKVSKLKNHIIICGLGRNGREVALELLRQQHAFVIVEQEQTVVDDFIAHHPETLVVLGDATHDDVLEKAGIHKARGLVSSLSSDAENVYITLTAREMCSKLNIVARASHEGTISKLKRAGANEVILPNLIGGRKMANLITKPALMEFIEMVTGESNPNLNLEEIPCANHPQLIGRTLSELHIRSRTGVLVIGHKRGKDNVELNPDAKDPLQADDRLFVFGTTEQLLVFKKIYLN